MSREEWVGSSWEDSPGLRELLRGKDARAILFRLSDGDPLELHGRCIEVLRRRAVLLDPRRVTMTAMSRIAYYGTHYAGSPAPPLWIASHVEEAVRDCIGEDELGLVDRVPVEPGDGRYSALAEMMGVTPELARGGCVVFQELPPEEREAFWALLVDGRTRASVAAESGVSPEEIQRRCDRAVRAFCTLGLEDGGGPEASSAPPEVKP